MTKLVPPIAALLLLLASAPANAGGVRTSLRGSHDSMERQNRIAHDEAFSFLRTNADVKRLAGGGFLVPASGNEDYEVIAGWPYTRPAVLSFVETLARDYRTGCGERLVVTSLTRPVRSQPRNASPLSVHPAGMAVDLRVSSRRACVRWLESELLQLEEAGVLDGTREYHPPHFHVAVFPEPYARWLQARVADSLRVEAARRDSILAAEPAPPASPAPVPTLATASASSLQRLGDVLLAVARLLLRV